jgi:branched-chain amino acid transport system ATP-binding protein
MPETNGAPVLSVRDLEAWYGESYVLHGMEFDVHEGEVVTLLGRNGAGKSTTFKALMGMVPRITGSAKFRGRELVGDAPHRIARSGLAYCPEERGIFASLTVMENLTLPPVVAGDPVPMERIFALFPNLHERRTTSQGSKLSGGEQQMLAIARILRTGARFLLLDEPNEGLAPVIVQQIGKAIAELKKAGLTMLLVEQNYHFAATVADRHYVVEGGRVVDQIANEDLKRNDAKLRAYLGV